MWHSFEMLVAVASFPRSFETGREEILRACGGALAPHMPFPGPIASDGTDGRILSKDGCFSKTFFCTFTNIYMERLVIFATAEKD
jgi:hypothetical protein